MTRHPLSALRALAARPAPEPPKARPELCRGGGPVEPAPPLDGEDPDAGWAVPADAPDADEGQDLVDAFRRAGL